MEDQCEAPQKKGKLKLQTKNLNTLYDRIEVLPLASKGSVFKEAGKSRKKA